MLNSYLLQILCYKSFSFKILTNIVYLIRRKIDKIVYLVKFFNLQYVYLLILHLIKNYPKTKIILFR